VPIANITMEETAAYARKLAERVGKELMIPVYCYENAAFTEERKNLANCRSGEYEGLPKKLEDPHWKPDFGPDTFNPAAGATIIGARHPMISFKAFLNTGDIEIAKALSQIIQHANGGLSHVNAYAGMDSEHNLTQITVTNANYRAMPMYRVLEMLRSEAKRFAVAVRKVEMIGLIPESAFIESALYYMGIQDFSLDRLLERKIQTHIEENIQSQ